MLKDIVFFKNLKKNFHIIDCLLLVLFIKFNKHKIYLPILKRNIYLRSNTKDLETFKEIFNDNIYNLQLPIVPKTIIDAGANVGFASLFFRLKYREAIIIAIEIEKQNVAMMLRNTINLKQLRIENKALFNRKSFFKIENPFNATNSFVIKEVQQSEKYDVEAITLEEILTLYKWETIDILKIDIEGAEIQLFERNYEKWLPKTKIIMVETHDRMVANCSHTVMKTINLYNFILFTTTEGTLIYYNMDLVTL